MIEALSEVKRELKWLVSLFALVIVLFVLLHTSSELAIRTHLFYEGYPKAAITSEIVEYEFYTTDFIRENLKGYTLTKPPTEKATESILDTYQVEKKGFLYFAEYYHDM